MPCFRYFQPDMKRCLIVPLPLLLAFALSCASPEQPAERVIPTQERPPIPTSTNVETPIPTTRPVTPPASLSRRGSVRLADDRSAPIVPVVPRDLISALFDPVHIRAAEVGEQAGESSLVIGVAIGSESVAYSVSYLSSREIVNDTVGGTPIAVTW